MITLRAVNTASCSFLLQYTKQTNIEKELTYAFGTIKNTQTGCSITGKGKKSELRICQTQQQVNTLESLKSSEYAKHTNTLESPMKIDHTLKTNSRGRKVKRELELKWQTL